MEQFKTPEAVKEQQGRNFSGDPWHCGNVEVIALLVREGSGARGESAA